MCFFFCSPVFYFVPIWSNCWKSFLHKICLIIIINKKNEFRTFRSRVLCRLNLIRFGIETGAVSVGTDSLSSAGDFFPAFGLLSFAPLKPFNAVKRLNEAALNSFG